MSFLKKFLIGLLALSNVLVLGVVFSVYFGNRPQSLYLFSLSDDLEDLRDKIQDKCSEDFTAVLNGSKERFICQVFLDQSHKGVSYRFKARFKVTKQEDSIQITEIAGSFRDRKEHITEADFCNDCFKDKSLDNSSDMETFMSEVSDLLEDMYDEAQESVEEAYDEEKQLDKEKQLAKRKERECEGFWNEESQSFEEFTQAQDRLNCRLVQIIEKDNLFEIEKFYHEKLKKHLWSSALSDEEPLDDEIFDSFHNPFRYSLSVRASMALLENYTRWKEDFDILESLRDKELFLQGIAKDVNSSLSFMNSDQKEQDLYYLNQGFDGLYKNLNSVNNTVPMPEIDYESVAEEVKSLY